MSLKKDAPYFYDIDNNKYKRAAVCSQVSYDNTICLEDHK
jgi:hypothetical protein